MKIGLDYILTSFLVRSSVQNFGHIYGKRWGMLAESFKKVWMSIWVLGKAKVHDGLWVSVKVSGCGTDHCFIHCTWLLHQCCRQQEQQILQRFFGFFSHLLSHRLCSIPKLWCNDRFGFSNRTAAWIVSNRVYQWTYSYTDGPCIHGIYSSTVRVHQLFLHWVCSC